MIATIVAGALAIALAPQQIDTTIAVRSGARLGLDAYGGTAVVRTWDREEVRVRTVGGNNTLDVQVRERSGGVQVTAQPRRGRSSANVTFEITVPRRFDVNVEGVLVGVTVDGVEGKVGVETVEGAVVVRGVTGDIAVETVSGAVKIENTRGSIKIISTNQNVQLVSVRGNVDAETVNGSIDIRGAESSAVRASTVNGIVRYEGTIQNGGRYYLGTHNGSITLAVAPQTNASVVVSTSSGKVESTFPIPLSSMRERRLTFALGTGSARVELESFNGTIHLVRPGR